MAISKDVLYTLYKARPDYTIGVGDIFFYSAAPHRSYYRTSIYTVKDVDGTDIASKQEVVVKYQPYFKLDRSYTREDLSYLYHPRPRYLAIKIISGQDCLFDTMPDSINLIGRKAAGYQSSVQHKSHVLVTDTTGYYDTRYKCSGVVLSGFIDLVHRKPIDISQVPEYSHLITCTNCQRRLNKWTE